MDYTWKEYQATRGSDYFPILLENLGPNEGLVSRVFTNGLEDQGSLPGSRHTKDFKNGTWYLLA